VTGGGRTRPPHLTESGRYSLLTSRRRGRMAQTIEAGRQREGRIERPADACSPRIAGRCSRLGRQRRRPAFVRSNRRGVSDRHVQNHVKNKTINTLIKVTSQALGSVARPSSRRETPLCIGWSSMGRGSSLYYAPGGSARPSTAASRTLSRTIRRPMSRRRAPTRREQARLERARADCRRSPELGSAMAMPEEEVNKE